MQFFHTFGPSFEQVATTNLHVVRIEPAEAAKEGPRIGGHNVGDKETNDSLPNKYILQPIAEHRSSFQGEVVLLLFNLLSEGVGVLSATSAITVGRRQSCYFQVRLSSSGRQFSPQIVQIPLQIHHLLNDRQGTSRKTIEIPRS